jgi:hypothetical protein
MHADGAGTIQTAGGSTNAISNCSITTGSRCAASSRSHCSDARRSGAATWGARWICLRTRRSSPYRLVPVTEGLADLRGQFIQQRPARQIRPFFLELLGVADRELSPGII